MRKEKRNVIFIANREQKHDRFFIGNIQETDDKGVLSVNDNCWISMSLLEFHCSCAKLWGREVSLLAAHSYSSLLTHLFTWSPWMPSTLMVPFHFTELITSALRPTLSPLNYDTGYLFQISHIMLHILVYFLSYCH